jgi:hypothetical protein
MSYHREIVNQTLKNQTTGNAEIRCRLEKTGKTGRPQRTTQIRSRLTQMPLAVTKSFSQFLADYSYSSEKRPCRTSIYLIL